jgi:ATP-dependent Lon protease
MIDKDGRFTLRVAAQQNDDAPDSIPILTPESEEDITNDNYPELLPILPVKNTVLFPGVVMPITVGRQRSIRLVKKAYKGDKIIGVIAQKNNNEDPQIDDLHRVGTVAMILKMLVLPDGNTTIIIQGRKKFKIEEKLQDEPFITAKVSYIKEVFTNKNRKEVKALIESLKENSRKIVQLNPEIPPEAQIALDNIESPSFLTYFLASNINANVEEKQKLLEITDGVERANILLGHLLKDLQYLQLKQEIQSKVHHDIDQQQRDYFLRQQIKVLQDELGVESTEQEIDKLRQRGFEKKWPEPVMQHFMKEVDKLSRINPMSAEFPVAMNYVEFLVDLPWNEETKDNFSLSRARKILDADHYGLEKVKERILEYLAVLKLKKNMKAPILCLYGPPGVGKTSLGRSIAKCLNRKYVRMSLGGLRDEAEIRGHRKTYVGAMPGRIIQSIKKVGSSNPVFILDEIDKIGNDFRGDPSSALLEVLDPEQNMAFTDNYLEVEYDLSKVLFIATSNALHTIQPALRDRMEIIEISGYSQEEKLQIAKRHLIPKQAEENGIADRPFVFQDEAIVKIIEQYTRESGVRDLERKIAATLRKLALKYATKKTVNDVIDQAFVEEALGAPVFDNEDYQDTEIAGVVTGLAWTSVGGEILFIESSLSKGSGKMILSGQLGDVMKESATTALSYLKAHADQYGIDHRLFQQYDLHIHVPAGAVPKDGPSAGITMFVSLLSAFTQRKIKSKIALTGEITLRGKVLPVGGIKEKILAAKRAHITNIILSVKNKKDVEEIDKEYFKGLKFHYVEFVDEVVAYALTDQKVKKAIRLEVDEK